MGSDHGWPVGDLQRRPALAQAPIQSEDGMVVQPKTGRVSLSSSDGRVDLGPLFKERGLSTRAQGSRGTCSVFTVTRAIEYALGKKQRRTLSIER